MRPPIYNRFVDKARMAMISAIEVYNKPSFLYRSETFAVLAINAWELLLKARLIKESSDLRSIFEYEQRKTKTGNISKRKNFKRNRAGNPMTIGMNRAITLLDQNATTRLSDSVRNNINALVEIRDNAIHFINPTSMLEKQILEINTAAVRNFVNQAKAWFGIDFSSDISLLMPLAFVSGSLDAAVIAVNADEKNLIDYLRKLASETIADDSDFQFALRIDLSFTRSKLDSASKVIVVSNDPSATRVELSEEDIRRNYPWDFNELIKRLRNRYGDFRQDPLFYERKRALTTNQALVRTRYLDPGNPKSTKKDFYNSNVLQYFDQFYKKK